MAPRWARALTVTLLVLTSLATLAAPAAAATTETEAERVVELAMAQLDDRWSFAANGPNEFDCSGLVFYAFREAGLRDRIGETRRTVAGYYKYFNRLGKADKANPRVGDLVVWGRNKHIGIYIGNGMAVSTLVNPHGVSVHPVKGYLNMRLKAYLHVALER
jgi:cell wall-associated NlpC family hydrolase